MFRSPFGGIMLKYLFSAALAFPIAARAQTVTEPAPTEKRPITVSGSVSLTSDYRIRGVSRRDPQVAVQRGLIVSHDSGIYVGVWGSNLASWSTFGGANLELDLVAPPRRISQQPDAGCRLDRHEHQRA